MSSEFIQLFPPEPPRLRPDQNVDEQLEGLGDAEGVHQMPNAPASGVILADPPTHEEAKKRKALYLWLICPEQPRVMYANELNPNALVNGRTRICHTNLSGGGEASGGGELWFKADDQIVVNGSSGRYPIKTLEQLEAAARVFTRLGYQTGHCGWDNDRDMPRRMARENDIIWV